MSYMVASAHHTANYTQHSRYTTLNTTHYTTRNATEMMPGSNISGQDRKNWRVFSFHSLKASKLQNAAPARSSVLLRAV